jgi:hypothetical protein
MKMIEFTQVKMIHDYAVLRMQKVVATQVLQKKVKLEAALTSLKKSTKFIPVHPYSSILNKTFFFVVTLILNLRSQTRNKLSLFQFTWNCDQVACKEI